MRQYVLKNLEGHFGQNGVAVRQTTEWFPVHERSVWRHHAFKETWLFFLVCGNVVVIVTAELLFAFILENDFKLVDGVIILGPFTSYRRCFFVPVSMI